MQVTSTPVEGQKSPIWPPLPIHTTLDQTQQKNVQRTQPSTGPHPASQPRFHPRPIIPLRPSPQTFNTTLECPSLPAFHSHHLHTTSTRAHHHPPHPPSPPLHTPFWTNKCRSPHLHRPQPFPHPLPLPKNICNVHNPPLPQTGNPYKRKHTKMNDTTYRQHSAHPNTAIDREISAI